MIQKVNFNTQEVIDGLTYYQSMRQYLDVPYADLTVDTVEVEFAKGTVPYIIVGPWAISEIQKMSSFLTVHLIKVHNLDYSIPN